MIASRKDHKAENDSYRKLAKYIADTKNDGEKVLMHWSAGCDFEDYIAGISEVEATQAKNPRSNLSKTYHLVVSFRPEDEAKLSSQAFIDIEKAFAQALGYENHQRHSGVHKNTDNLHLHMAVNMVDKQKFWRREPYRDFYKISRVCREMEKKYKLAHDPGLETESPKKTGKANAKVKAIEAQTGQESLFGYVMRHRDNLLREIELASTWVEVHQSFLKRGLVLKPSGNGLTIQDRYGKHKVKPSNIDRSLGRGCLEKKFGSFECPSSEQARDTINIDSYSAIPLHLGPERDNLYKIFQEEMNWRKAALAEIKRESCRLYDANKSKWEQKRAHFKKVPMMRRDRDRLMLELKEQEQKDLDKIRVEIGKRRDSVRAAIPYTTWNKCLQHKAARGDEVALAILRSKRNVVSLERIIPAPEQPKLIYSERKKWQQMQKDILDMAGISKQNRRALLSVVKMREVYADIKQFGQEPKYRIDGRGTIIFELPTGGTIRDTGREIHFSHHDNQAEKVAMDYAKRRWGASFELDNAKIVKKDSSKNRNTMDSGYNSKKGTIR